MVERLRKVSIGLSVVGIAIAGYMTWTHFTNTSVQCLGGSNECDIVQMSVYSSVAGIPVALLGLIGYVTILGLLFVEQAKGRLAENALLLIFGLTLVGAAYSAYLTYLELFVIEAICQYCVASAMLMAGLFGIAVYRVLASAPD